MPRKRATAKANAENVDLSLRLAPFFRPILADFVDATDEIATEEQPESPE